MTNVHDLFTEFQMLRTCWEAQDNVWP